MANDDAVLVEAARAGDKAAFAELVRCHGGLLAALCRRALGDADLAEDAAQEAILRALLGLDRLRRPERFGPWLAGIGLNVCRQWLRRRPHEAWTWDAVQGGRHLREGDDLAADPAELVEEAEARARVRAAVTALPPGQRAAVALVYLAGLTQREAAAELGIAEGAVKTRLFKARATLRRRLTEPTEADGGAGGGIVHDMRQGSEMVEVRVSDVVGPRSETPHRHYAVLLREVGGDRVLPIWVGEFEATSIALHLAGAEHPRPLTYAFAASLLQAGGARLREVRIERLEGDAFYATANVDGPAGTAAVDARPSDAINLALIAAAPIRAAADLFDSCGRPGEDVAPLGEGAGAAAIAAGVVATWNR
ncbi:MAG: bifunctional nuclease family protein [Chloroflexia bacterium]|nr:bifunctional nuclease family protein [Chloroflexia bacterium]